MDEIRTTSTSRHTADVKPLVLRETGTTRLVFKPTLIENNPRNPEAYVRGVLCYQRPKQADEWEDLEAINLGTLRSGEGVRLELPSDALHRLYRRLQDLYAIAAEHGVKAGERGFIETPQDSRVKQFIESLAGRPLSGAERIDMLQVFADWLWEQDPETFAQKIDLTHGHVANFDAALAAARLQSVLQQIRDNGNNDSEAFWQQLFSENNWVLSQVYAEPLIVIQDQAYVGGKAVTNLGGKVADYLFVNPFTHNPVLIEIKTPTVPLLRNAHYREGVFGPSTELTGGIAQSLHNRSQLTENYRQLAGDEELQVRSFRPRALLVIGNLQFERFDGAHMRSWELYRQSFRDLEIVTFDEVAEKITQLLSLLSTGAER